MKGTQMVSVAVATTLDLPFASGRQYLAYVPTADTTITIGGGAPFTLAVGQVWSPVPAPINDIAFSGAGTLITG